MSFVTPSALLLMLPALALMGWILLWRGSDALRLPGHWHRLIDPVMQPFMARQVVSPNRMPWVFWLAVWTLLVLGLARPVIGWAAPSDFGNLAGRVIALDMGAGVPVERQKLLVYRIIEASPATPTALVVATAEAFDIVPFTTDRSHIERYLEVLSADVMPVAGRATGIAVVHAERVLQRAGLAVGQLVLLSGGRAPPSDTVAAGDWLRAVVVDDAAPEWQVYARSIGARLADGSSLDDVIDDLDDAVADALRGGDRSGDLELRPWLIAGAALLWLLYFRRIRSS